MKNYKIELNEHEMNTLCYAVEKLRNETSKGLELWRQFDEEPPEYLQTEYTELNELCNKLLTPF